MRYLALASDYDGTLATDGQVEESTLAALRRLRDSGRQLILVTGRQLDDLLRVFAQVDLFDYVIAENGALLYSPVTRQEKLLSEPSPKVFVQKLQERGVEPLSLGRVIVATWHPHETTVQAVLNELSLDWQVILNKDAVMVLPAGLDKAAGLQVALKDLALSADAVVGVGDAENDQAFLDLCGYSVAVANALPMLREHCDWVTEAARGAGVVELIEKLITSDL
ncbi:HAD family hydrolase [Leptolyngbya sp. FACHB-261]|uniref:HAD family hydrolase n=1 Tax=Leptolyngbya sp. FACHB-261 TaxID=2692806 RepID=UPI001683C680|nr:HAD family hydrolase [Leptolyngbya sp. FACHB-261]MBD2100584.1 HAD family phosphatase [Leptolyngbya sp. FACHB-261]